MPRNITLRPLRASDLTAFMTWAGDPHVTESLFWEAYADAQPAELFLKNVVEKHPWFMAICADTQPIGAITLDRGQGRYAHRAELGYVLAHAFWGQGIATQACQLALAHGFSDLKIKRIEATVDPENIASVRVLEKSGMHREGLLKQYVTHRGNLKDRYMYAKTL